MSHLSFEGQSKLSYCLECSTKHGQAAISLMQEALQRAQACQCTNSDGVLEKVRDVVSELSGFDKDTEDNQENLKVAELNGAARDLRKFIYESNAEVGAATLEQLQGIKNRLETLVDKVYEVRKSEDCPTCRITGQQVEAPPLEPKPSLADYGKQVSARRRAYMEQIRSELG